MQHSHKAKKQFGQNFLKDESILHQIIQAMPNDTCKVVEIGPGLGDLTNYLVDVRSVIAFEVDRDLCKHLNEKFEQKITTKQLELHCGDVLETWQNALLDEPYNLVANLPYYIGTTIILKALADPMCQNVLVMVQKEVAQKFAAQPSEKVFGSLGVITQSVGTASIVTTVPPSAFEPMPKVDSAILLIKKKHSRSNAAFEAMLKTAFAQPRKTLMKNLTSRYDKACVLKAFETLKLPLTIRPHQITTDDYHQLYTMI